MLSITDLDLSGKSLHRREWLRTRLVLFRFQNMLKTIKTKPTEDHNLKIRSLMQNQKMLLLEKLLLFLGS